MNGQYQDARDVVLTTGSLLLREVADKMAAFIVILGHDIEQEWFHIKVECFGSEKEFCEQA